MRFSVVVMLIFVVVALAVEVTIITHPRCWIYVDGEPFFQTPRTLDLSPGEHEIKVIGWGTEPTLKKIVVPSEGKLIVEIRPKLLKGWSKRVGVLVLQDGGNLDVSSMIARKLREYNVDAFVVNFGRDTVSYSYLRQFWDIFAHPDEHSMGIMSAPYIFGSFLEGTDFMIVGNFKVLESGSGKTGILKLIVYDAENGHPLPCVPKVSDYDIYPAYPRDYFEKIMSFSSFSITGMAVGEDEMEMAEKAFDNILSYLVEMVMGYSAWKGLNVDEIFFENSQETLDEFIWYLEKMYLMSR